MITLANPTSPWSSKAPTLYRVTGSADANKPNFKYICDIYDANNYLLSRLKQNISEEGYAVFDISKIVDSKLHLEQTWTISSLSAILSSSVQDFTIGVGQQYSNTVSSSLIIEDSLLTDSITLFSSKNVNVGYSPKLPTILSNKPDNEYLTLDDYETVTLYTAGSITVEYKLNGATIASASYVPTSLGFYEVPISGKNIGVTNYDEIVITVDGVSKTYKIKDKCDSYVRFAFQNSYGFWDYYSSYTTVKKSTQINSYVVSTTKVSFDRPPITQDFYSLGRNKVNVQSEQQYQITTDYLTKAQSDWLLELFESKEVWLQIGNDFHPIVITNQSVDVQLDRNRQKTFQYQITFQPTDRTLDLT